LPSAGLPLRGTRLPSSHDSEGARGWGPAEERILRSHERQQIARELHDSTSQLLVVLQLQLSQLSQVAHPDAASLIDECKATIEEIHEQIRALNCK
jgi:signal transduction histidine kinase